MNSKILLNILSAFFMATVSHGQIDQGTMEASVIVTDNNSDDPMPGTIRWNGQDFQGWNGLSWVSLTGNTIVGSVTDIDNNVYKTVKIGNQIWMAENLGVQHLNDGSMILQEGQIGLPGSVGYRYYYDTDEASYASFNENFGALYSWNVINTGKLCPSGFHVPLQSEWIILSDYLGGIQIAGGKLKTPGSLSSDGLWVHPNLNATNESSFSVLPGGFRNEDGDFTQFYYVGKFWTSDGLSLINNVPHAPTEELRFDHEDINQVFEPTNVAANVRCIKD